MQSSLAPRMGLVAATQTRQDGALGWWETAGGHQHPGPRRDPAGFQGSCCLPFLQPRSAIDICVRQHHSESEQRRPADLFSDTHLGTRRVVCRHCRPAAGKRDARLSP